MRPPLSGPEASRRRATVSIVFYMAKGENASVYCIQYTEADRLPVLVAHLDADLGSERLAEFLGPLVVLGHEPLVVDVDLVAVDRGGGHLRPPASLVRLRVGSFRPSTSCLLYTSD